MSREEEVRQFPEQQTAGKKLQQLHSSVTFERNVVDAIAHQKIHHAQPKGKKKKLMPKKIAQPSLINNGPSFIIRLSSRM